MSSLPTPFALSSASNWPLSMKSRRTWSWRSVVQSSLIAPLMWPLSYAEVSSSTSTSTMSALSRLSSTHWAETRVFSRLMRCSYFLLRAVVRWCGGAQPRVRAAAEQVGLATETEADGGVEQGGHQGERGGDVPHDVRAGEEADEGDGDEGQPDALGEAGRGRVLEVARRAEPGTHDRAEQRRDRRALDAAQHRGREQRRLDARAVPPRPDRERSAAPPRAPRS